MAVEIIDGTGSGFLAQVDSSNRLSVTTSEPLPTAGTNPAYEFIYEGTNVGSIIQYVDLDSYTQVLTWSGNTLTNIGSWS